MIFFTPGASDVVLRGNWWLAVDSRDHVFAVSPSGKFEWAGGRSPALATGCTRGGALAGGFRETPKPRNLSRG
jgi:hypothetical protein